MTRRQPLRFRGDDVMIVGRLADGHAVVALLDREGALTRVGCRARDIELRGIGWHLADIKKAIRNSPLVDRVVDALALPASTPSPAPVQPRALLHAHHAAPSDD